MQFEHNYNIEFEILLNDANKGRLGELTEAFLRPAYYGTSLSGVGINGYDGRKLIARTGGNIEEINNKDTNNT